MAVLFVSKLSLAADAGVQPQQFDYASYLKEFPADQTDKANVILQQAVHELSPLEQRAIILDQERWDLQTQIQQRKGDVHSLEQKLHDVQSKLAARDIASLKFSDINYHFETLVQRDRVLAVADILRQAARQIAAYGPLAARESVALSPGSLMVPILGASAGAALASEGISAAEQSIKKGLIPGVNRSPAIVVQSASP